MKHMVCGSSKMAWAIESILVPLQLTVLGPESRSAAGMPDLPSLSLVPLNQSVTIKNAPYMPITITRRSRGVVEVAHFALNEIAPRLYEPVPDPRMIFSVYWPLLGFVPMRLEQRIMFNSGWAATDYDWHTGRIFTFSPAIMAGQVKFSNLWAGNLLEQGFAGSKQITYSWAVPSPDTCAEAALG